MSSIVTEKYCKACKAYKPTSDFSKWRGICKGCEKAEKRIKARIRYNTNTEYVLRLNREWKNRNPEKKKQSDVRWRENNRDKKRANNKKWSSLNPEKIYRSNVKWISKNKDKRKAYNWNRRAKIYSSGGTITKTEWKDLLKKSGYKCMACGKGKDLTLDHVVPLFFGGKHEISNAQVLCLSCNSSKGTKTIDYRI